MPNIISSSKNPTVTRLTTGSGLTYTTPANCTLLKIKMVGGGGGAQGDGSRNPGAGGGAGGYIDAIILNPAAGYSYSVGTGGNGGTGTTFSGSNGGSGIIIIEESYA